MQSQTNMDYIELDRIHLLVETHMCMISKRANDDQLKAWVLLFFG